MSLVSFLSNLKNPISYWLGWTVCETQQGVGLTVDVCFCLCVSLLFPSSLWNHAQLGGGSDVERMMSALAYGWVERCNDVASCRTRYFKISILVYFIFAFVLSYELL